MNITLPREQQEWLEAQVKAGATTVLGSENSVIAIVGDYAKVKDQLAAYTNITFLDTDGKVIAPPQ